MRPTRPPHDVESYIAAFPSAVRGRLKTMRATIKRAAPNALEKISYRMPAYSLCGSLVWFAAFENHIGFYPGASGVKKFTRELRAYRYAKGSVQFPHDRPVPLALVAEIVAFRAAENLARWAAKTREKPAAAARRGRRRSRAS